MAIAAAHRLAFVAGSKALTPDQNDRVREWVRMLLMQHDGNQTVFAPKIGLRQSTLSRFLTGHTGTSYSVVEKVAELAEKTEREILGKSPAPPVPMHERRRRLAAQLAIEDKVDEEVVAAFLAEAMRPEDAGLSTAKWIDRIHDMEVLVLRERKKSAPDEKAPPDESGARRIPGRAETAKKRQRRA